jgi:hypothetical protein
MVDVSFLGALLWILYGIADAPQRMIVCSSIRMIMSSFSLHYSKYKSYSFQKNFRQHLIYV